MRTIKLSLCLVTIFVSVISSVKAQEKEHSTGYILDNEADLQLPKSPSYYNRGRRGFYASSTDLPPSYSLKKYCPTPRDQGNYSTCAAWSMGYGGYTILYTLNNNIQKQEEIDKVAFSALYIYEQAMNVNYDMHCGSGTNFINLRDALNTYGICLLSDFDKVDCKRQFIPDKIQQKAGAYRNTVVAEVYHNYNTIAAKSNNELVEDLKRSIYHGHPVYCGIWAYGLSGLKPPYEFKSVMAKDGHGVLCIGYDDKMQRFEFMNSWGTDWGNKGFFFVKYEDISNTVKCAFGISLVKPVNINRDSYVLVNADVTINVAFDDMLLRQNFMLNENKYYNLNTMLNKKFNISLSSNGIINPKDDYKLYVMNVDPLGKKMVLFPSMDDNFNNNFINPAGEAYTKESAPMNNSIYSNSVLTIPNPAAKQNGLIKSKSGTEPLIILITPVKDINPNLLFNDISVNGDYFSQIEKAIAKHYPDMKMKREGYAKDFIGVRGMQLKYNEILPIIINFND